MNALVVVALGIAALVYVLRPLLSAAVTVAPSRERDARVRKMRALEAILDLEADLAAGKLSPDDYAAFREMYERDAVSALRELDVLAEDGENADLEAEIAAARAELR